MLDECLLFKKQIQHEQVCLAQSRWFDYFFFFLVLVEIVKKKKKYVGIKEAMENMVFLGGKKLHL